MKSSCVHRVTAEPVVVIRKWQVTFCDGNHCAAALLSFFEYWHNIKLEIQVKNRQANDIAEMHGDIRTQDETLYQFHSFKELEENLLGLYSKTTIAAAVKLLAQKGAISIHRNPNPRYAFDRTNYYLFHPEVLNDWLMKQRRDNIADSSFSDNRECKNSQQSTENNPPSTKSNPPSSKNEQAITEITTETTTEITTEIYNKGIHTKKEKEEIVKDDAPINHHLNLDFLKKKFPTVDVEKELHAIYTKIRDNPHERPLKGESYILDWLAEAQRRSDLVARESLDKIKNLLAGRSGQE